MSQFAQNLLAAVLGGIVVSLFVFYFLGNKPGAPRISVTRSVVAVSAEAANGVWDRLAASTIEKSDVVRNIKFYSGGLLEVYRIENYGDEILKHVVIGAKEYEAVVINSAKSLAFPGKEVVHDIEMAPGDVVEVLTVGNGSVYSTGIYGGGKTLVSVDNKVLPVVELSFATFGDFSFLLQVVGKYPFFSIILMAIGAASASGAIIAVTIAYLTKDNMEFLAKNTQDESLATALRTFLFIRKSDAARAQKVRRLVRRATKTTPSQ